MSIESENLSTARKVVETYNRSVRTYVEECFAEEFEWVEAPTRVNPAGRAGGRKELLEAGSFSEAALKDESMEVLNMIASGDTVVLESIWRGTLTVDMKRAPAGTHVEARAAQILRFRDGKIISSHEYPCGV